MEISERDCEEFTALVLKMVWIVCALASVVHDVQEGIDYWFIAHAIAGPFYWVAHLFGWVCY